MWVFDMPLFGRPFSGFVVQHNNCHIHSIFIVCSERIKSSAFALNHGIIFLVHICSKSCLLVACTCTSIMIHTICRVGMHLSQVKSHSHFNTRIHVDPDAFFGCGRIGNMHILLTPQMYAIVHFKAAHIAAKHTIKRRALYIKLETSARIWVWKKSASPLMRI